MGIGFPTRGVVIVNMDFWIRLDRDFLHFFNGSDNLLLDQIVLVLTSGFTWVALYLVLLFVVIKNSQTMAQIMSVVGGALLCIFLADGLADGIVKPIVARWRPTNDPLIKYTVDTVNQLRESNYGFFSAHAANTMSVAFFFSLLMKSNKLTIGLFLWSFLNCWTRLYLGVHYPGDVLVGILWGLIAGGTAYLLYLRIYKMLSPSIKYVSNQYTRSGFERADMDLILNVLVLTVGYAFVRGLFMVNL